jgi:hypothetical protein
VKRLERLSEPFGTRIEFSDGVGRVILPSPSLARKPGEPPGTR